MVVAGASGPSGKPPHPVDHTPFSSFSRPFKSLIRFLPGPISLLLCGSAQKQSSQVWYVCLIHATSYHHLYYKERGFKARKLSCGHREGHVDTVCIDTGAAISIQASLKIYHYLGIHSPNESFWFQALLLFQRTDRPPMGCNNRMTHSH